VIGAFVDRLIRSQGWLDGFAEVVQEIVGGFFKILGAPGRLLKSFLHGTFFGHALHPVLTDIPLGAWSVALVADIVAMTGHLSPQVGDFCVLIGVIGALGAAVTGYTDFHETTGHERRVGALHGLLNTVVLVLYVASLYLRWQGGAGSHSTAFWISAVGYGIVTSAAYLGGHLVFGMGTMVNRSAFLEGPDMEYVGVGQTSDFLEGQMKKVSAGGLDVLVVRYEGRIHAISNVCSHAGGPLDEGSLEGAVVTCPWHASQFRVDTGVVRCGPATFSQPLLRVLEEGETISVKLAEPLHG
jgi:nitrite reductase/ring-hydroxylating ferredoxin subunit/uncharacterized membrane protein